MKIKVIILLGALLVSFSSFSQSASEEQAKAKKLYELVELMNMDSMMDTMYSQLEFMMQNMSAELGVQPHEKPIFDTYYSQMTELMREDLSWSRMQPMIIDVYARNFSDQEIDDMIAFYKTETGQTVIEKLPVVMQESMMGSQTLMQGLMPKIQKIAEQLGADLAKARGQNQ
jgi:hypothetical protein